MERGACAEAAARVSADSWDWHWRRVRLPMLPRRINPNVVFARRLLARALPPDARSVFEVGCAPGAWLGHFARRHPALRVAGCDLAPAGVRATRENLELLGIEARLYEADVFQLAESPPDRFDLVYSMGVVEHFDDLEGIVAAHAKLCRPGGRVVVTAPNLLGFSGALLRAASPTLMESHRVVRPEDLARAARAAGLLPLSARYAGPLSAFPLLDRAEGRLRHLLGYGLALALGFLTGAARRRYSAGAVQLVAHRPG